MYENVLTFADAFWITLCQMAPYLLFGFLMAGVLSILISPEFVERHLGGRGLWPVIKATLFGIPLPLCSCGVIPVAASLRRHGATRGATTSFLLSTPQTGVDSILVTFSVLGPIFAVFRPLAALVNGILGGAIVDLIDPAERGQEKSAAKACQAQCCTGDRAKNRLLRVFRYGFVTLAEDIARPLVLGLIIAGLIAAIVPDDFFAGALGTGITPMLVMMLFGIPLYVCATASVPVVAALIVAGVSPGAALVFLMTGPATNAAAIATIWKIMGKRTALVYLTMVAVTALACGILLDYVFMNAGTDIKDHMHQMEPGIVSIVSAIVLIAVLAKAIVLPSGEPVEPEAEAEEAEQHANRLVLSVGGMTCSHCAQSIQRALSELAGVSWAQVNLKAGEAIVIGSKLDTALLVATVEELGYKADLPDDRD